MHVERHEVELVTATGGAAEAFTETVTGAIGAVIYTKAAGGDAFASTADIAVTVERTGENVWTESNVNASKTVRPMRPGSTASGAAATGAFAPMVVAKDRLKITVAEGGNTKRGAFAVLVY